MRTGYPQRLPGMRRLRLMRGRVGVSAIVIPVITPALACSGIHGGKAPPMQGSPPSPQACPPSVYSEGDPELRGKGRGSLAG